MSQRLNPNILSLKPYVPGKPIEELKRQYRLDRVVKLGSNENPLPPPENIQRAIKEEIARLNLYPDSDSYHLRQAVSRKWKLSPEQVVVGAGSVEIIRMIVQTFMAPGDSLLTSEKAFMMFRIAALEKQGPDGLVEAPMDDCHRFSLSAITDRIDQNTRIIALVNPNNPTGTMLDREDLAQFIDSVPEDKLIVLDNAYDEYVTARDNYLDGLDLVRERRNVIVLRTFSKVYSLAGLRVGYGLGHSELIASLHRVKPPFNVSRLSQRAAMAALENDDFARESAQLNQENRHRLAGQLEELGLRVIPSETNFLLFYPGVAVDRLNTLLLERGIIVRPLKPFGIPDGIRVSVGLREDNDYFIEVLKTAINQLR